MLLKKNKLSARRTRGLVPSIGVLSLAAVTMATAAMMPTQVLAQTIADCDDTTVGLVICSPGPYESVINNAVTVDTLLELQGTKVTANTPDGVSFQSATGNNVSIEVKTHLATSSIPNITNTNANGNALTVGSSGAGNASAEVWVGTITGDAAGIVGNIDDGTLDIVLSAQEGPVVVTGTNADGIKVNAGNNDNATVNVYVSAVPTGSLVVPGTVTVNADASDDGGGETDNSIDIDARDANEVNVVVGENATLNASDNGIRIDVLDPATFIPFNPLGGDGTGGTTGLEEVNVTFDGNIVAGDNGIDIEGDDGQITVIVDANGNIAAGANGVVAVSDTGGISVTTRGAIGVTGTPVGSDGIETFSVNGLQDINVEDGGAIFAGDNGIRATSGLILAGDSDINIDVGDALNAGENGIFATSTRGGDVTINLRAIDPNQLDVTLNDPLASGTGGSIVADESGINVIANNGNTSITSAATINAEDYGISVDYLIPDGAVALTEAITITTNLGGSITSNLTGIRALGDDGAIAINVSDFVDSAGFAVDADHDGDGIYAASDEGAINITTNTGAWVRADQDGIRADSDDANVTVAVGANVTAGRSGIDVENALIANVDIGSLTNTGLAVIGAGTNNRAVVEIDAQTSIAFNNYGTVHSGDYGIDLDDTDDLIVQADDQAIDLSGGSPTVTSNYGTIIGQFDGTNDADTFANYSPNTWVFTGTSNFEGGDDVLNNIYTDSLTAGRIVNAVDGTASETATYRSLEQFNNAGLVSLSDADTGTFYRDRAFTSGDYDGDAGTIELDAFLSDDLTTSDADRFIIGGEATGTTWVTINDQDTSLGALGDIIPVIEIDDGLGGGTFKLTNGPIDKGLYSYDLFYMEEADIYPAFADSNDTNTSDSLANTGLPGSDPDQLDEAWVLTSYADASVNNLSAIPGIVAGNWNALAEGWQERSGDLRNYFMEPAGPLAYAPSDVILPTGETRDIGIWGRLVGLGGERTGSAEFEALPGVFVPIDTGYREQLVGGQAGIDFAFHLEDSTIVFGLMGSYAQSEVAFNEGDVASLSTPSIGAYADWIMGGTYFNALAKVDFIGLDYAYGMNSDSTTGLAIGGAIEAGHRFDFDSLFIEPVARVSYVETDLDTFNIGPDEVDLHGSSFQAKAGGRIGGTFATETYTVAPYVSGYVGYEFLGESSADIETIMDPVTTDFSGAFAEVGAGVNVDDVDGSGLTGFADANLLVAEDFLGASASVGVRANF